MAGDQGRKVLALAAESWALLALLALAIAAGFAFASRE
jgi:hypothetical protein